MHIQHWHENIDSRSLVFHPVLSRSPRVLLAFSCLLVLVLLLFTYFFDFLANLNNVQYMEQFQWYVFLFQSNVISLQLVCSTRTSWNRWPHMDSDVLVAFSEKNYGYQMTPSSMWTCTFMYMRPDTGTKVYKTFGYSASAGWVNGKFLGWLCHLIC